MQIQFHGAVRTVTGSQHLLTINGLNILLDCGLYQGHRDDSYTRNLNLPFAARDVDVMILSHAHIDHSGNIPNLVKSGFRGDIITTAATRDLCNVMLRDSAKIQEADIEFVNKRRAKQYLPPLAPLYTLADALQCMRHFIGINYERPYRVSPEITLTFYDAGHMLGSAIVQLDIIDKETDKAKRLIFSGDLGRTGRPILADPTFMKEADILLLESTYGNREHQHLGPDKNDLLNVVNQTYASGGKVIIPAFAVGRTQELVYVLHQLMQAGDIPHLPIYIDSPLAINATGVFRLHPEAFDDEMANLLLRGEDPLASSTMHYTRSVEESKGLNALNTPAVIISASGMAENGRILHHLRNNIENPRNTILIVGWQAPYTLGRRLADKEKQVRIFGEPFKVNAKVKILNGFSGHADRSELLEWAGHFTKRPQKTFLVHGELEAAEALAADLRLQGFPEVFIPEMGQTFEM